MDGPGGEHIWDIPVSRITAGVMKVHKLKYSDTFISYTCAGPSLSPMPLRTRLDLHEIYPVGALSANISRASLV